MSHDERLKSPAVEEVPMAGLNLLASVGGYVVEEVEEADAVEVEGGVEKETEEVGKSEYHSMAIVLYGKPKAYVPASEVVCLIKIFMKGSLLTMFIMNRFMLSHITVELQHRIHESLRKKKQHHLQIPKITGHHQRMIKCRIRVHQILERLKIDVIQEGQKNSKKLKAEL